MAATAMEGNASHRAGISSQELLQEMKAFLTGIDPVHGHKLTVKDHARCGILLLRNLPPARGAVLEHLRGVFDEYVSGYILDLNHEGGGGVGGGLGPLGRPGLDDVTQEIQSVLSEFVHSNPEAWAPLVSAWSIDLMGQLSSKYSGRHQVPHASSLNELLQLWMSCKATRVLMEIYVQCLSSMISSCPDACVDALLDTSVQHSPHFDWVVAHIGSSFPNTIISRVLSCGLKDFCMHGASSVVDPLFPSLADKRVPKVASVVGILGHLATRHSDSIKQELLLMFHESLGSPRDPQQHATVPFLLQLAAMSPMLLSTVSGELIDSLKPPVLDQLHQHFAGLSRDDTENLVGLVVHLICQTGPGAYRILQFLVNTAMPASVITTPGLAVRDSVREACHRIIQLLLLNLQKLVYNRPSASLSEPQPRAIPFFDELKGRVRDLCVETLRLERKRHLWQHQLLGLLSVYCGQSCATESLCHLLALASSPEELALAVQLYGGLAASMPGLLPATIRRCVTRLHSSSLPEAQAARLMVNLATLVQWEGPEEEVPSPIGARLAEALSWHVRDLGQLLPHSDPQVSEAAALLLSAVPLPPALSPAQLAGLVRSAVGQFLLALRRGREAAASDCARLLTRLSAVSPAALRAVLQQLVRSATHGGSAGLFGGRAPGVAWAPGAPPAGAGDSLLDVNRKFGTAVNFGGSVWAVFHAGVIGRGLKPASTVTAPGPQEAAHNLYQLLSLVVRCGSGGRPLAQPDPSLTRQGPPPINPEAAKAVAVALVEGLCPDVTNSELAWPPEDHTRNTVERDLQIQNRFEENPLLFLLLQLVALGRPALCYCSVLLRGLLATLMAHWEASRHSLTTSSPWQLQASCSLVSCMGEGQLLPPVLSNMHEIFHLLTPFEVHLLLLSIWDYMKDNGPLPQKFTFDPEQGQFYRDFSRDGDISKYLNVLHSILHKNIDHLGHLCGRFQV
ncbi:integrator complex subunit 5 [Carcharodon carcharias]|uniref:integrator complex subunit 5 n=1 Tax=Carcharodon carcharias TaxID=13397 RepID=UPI001B7F062D|nr:integrator complex subunit 5 [Carcharodon carcharias]